MLDFQPRLIGIIPELAVQFKSLNGCSRTEHAHCCGSATLTSRMRT